MIRKVQGLRRDGFTAAELLVVAAGVAILAAAAAPEFLAMAQTARLNGAVRRIAGELHYSQSLAVNNGGCYRLRTGGDPAVNRPNAYRIERGGCDGLGWPALTDTSATNPAVISDWKDLGAEFPGVDLGPVLDGSSATLGSLGFNSRGFSAPPFPGVVTHPITLTIRDRVGGSRILQIQRTGSMRVQ
jgi:Tfp pilus assembly protein FimT